MAGHPVHPPPLRCVRCGDVIGVYEPAVVVEDDAVRHTSLAAEPPAERGLGTWLHRACFVAAQAVA